MVADLICDDPQQMPRIVVIRVSRENLPVNRLCLVQAARLVMLERDSECFRNCGHGPCVKDIKVPHPSLGGSHNNGGVFNGLASERAALPGE
jgi:hypothetical protein